MTILKLFSRCLFGHGDQLRTRDGEGYLVLQCTECGEVTRLFEQPLIKGPRHIVEPVKGAPSLKARKVAPRERQFPRSVA